MNFLKQNKYHLIACFAIVLLFLITTDIRRDNLSVPLSRHHEWITAHTLITCDIWENNGGPSAYHFSPVYTYPGEGNKRRTMLGGVVDEKGEVYYVSYPPFSFLFAYYATQVLGGPDTDSIRSLNLAIHLLCSLLLYLIAVSLKAQNQRRDVSIAGITAAFLYLFSCGNLWMHGNLYFADMLVQLFVIAAIYLFIRFLKKQYTREVFILSALAAVFFLATYTEWLGMFLAFFAGLALLISWFIVRESRYIKALLVIAFSSALAVVIMLMQYSSIAGWDKFKEVSLKKYTQRSGHETAEETPNQFNLENAEAYDFMIDRMDDFYKMAENFVGIFAIILIALACIPNLRRKMENAGVGFLVLGIFACSVLLHYYLFFNFNSLHDFSSLKTGFLMILATLIFVSLVEASLNLNFRLMVFGVVGYLAVDKGMESIEKYREMFPLAEMDWNRISTGKSMNLYGRKDAAIFMNISSNPELVLQARHNVFPVKDTADIRKSMISFKNEEAQYYHHIGNKLEYILEFRLVNGQLIESGRINLNGEQNGSGRVHQK